MTYCKYIWGTGPFLKRLVKVGVTDFHKVSWRGLLLPMWGLIISQPHISHVSSFCIQVLFHFNFKYVCFVHKDFCSCWSLSFDALREFWKLANILSVNFRWRSTKLISCFTCSFFLIGIHAIQGWTATTRHGVKKRST